MDQRKTSPYPKGTCNQTCAVMDPTSGPIEERERQRERKVGGNCASADYTGVHGVLSST